VLFIINGLVLFFTVQRFFTALVASNALHCEVILLSQFHVPCRCALVDGGNLCCGSEVKS
jgi:hypothetical protein